MALILAITNAGRAALRNADASGTRAVRIASVGVSAAALAATVVTAALPGEVKRITTVSGAAVASDIIHLVVNDETMATYTVRSFALYLDDGTLFAAYGQADPIIEKSAQALMVLTIDVTLADITASQITFGDANFLMPPATVDRQGLIELATEAETVAGTDRTRAVTPYTLRITYSDVWRASNDGAGSGLDADLLDGRQGAEYALLAGATFTGSVFTRDLYARDLYASRGDGTGIVYLNAAQNRYLHFDGAAYQLANAGLVIAGATAWTAGNDGSGSGLDADLLDGRQGAEFALLAGASFTGAIRVSGTVTARTSGGYAQLVPATNASTGYIAFHGNDDVRRGYVGFAAANGPIQLASENGAGFAVTGGPLAIDGSIFARDLYARDLYASRSDGTGIVYLNAAQNRYLHFDGAAYQLANAGLVIAGATAWTAGNDGSGSGLDADLLDGRQGSEFALLAGASFTGAIRVSGTVAARTSGGYAQLVPATNASTGYIAFHGNDDVRRGYVGFAAANGPIQLASENGAGFAITGGPLAIDGSVFARDLYARDLYASRSDGTGIVYLNTAQNRYLHFDGAAYQLANAGLVIAGATAWTAGNDGSGSGLDADLLDGRQGSEYALLTGASYSGTISAQTPNIGSTGGLRLRGNPVSGRAFLQVTSPDLSNEWGAFSFDATGAMAWRNNQVWHAGNDGAGSGLDADLLDGWERDELRSWANLLDVPGAFPPSGHAHGATDISGAFLGSLSENGYTVLPNGLILQWVTGSLMGAGQETSQLVYFPVAFPNACFGALAGTRDEYFSRAADVMFSTIGAPATDTVTVGRKQFSGSSDDQVASRPFIVALGR